MSRKISAPNIISGTHGKVWWDDSAVYEISSFEATLDPDREDVTFSGDMIKDSKLKVQAQVQGEQVRVTGKSRDDLQGVMALIRGADLGQPFQFNNFRD